MVLMKSNDLARFIFTKTILNIVLRMFWEEVRARNKKASCFNNNIGEKRIINESSHQRKSLIKIILPNSMAIRCWEPLLA